MGGERVENGGHWARSQLPILRGRLPGSPPPATPRQHLFALTPLYVCFHLKSSNDILGDRDGSGKQAEGGRAAPFVKRAAGR